MIEIPRARHILPTYTERTSYGVAETNPYNKLYEERIVFLGVQVDDASASDIMAQLLHLEGEDPDRDIELYINSPGGSLTAMMAIYDTMQYIRPKIRTVCLGQAALAAALLLAAGEPGMRTCLPNARALIQQPTSEPLHGHISDMEIQAAEMLRTRRRMETTLAKHTGNSAERIHADIERAKILTADEMKDYGIVDEVVAYRKAN
ncbi:ATP-dependent Clp protease, protease subunit [Amycolatopsis xylanica]|uniref:ATP-dependent Clp protease proteolytic subunit n=1 Tax=Amycolatopsis xylanica TaxID=589385 RepID=A0A1H2TXJ2_9PSEU|nr:ATP-dependent Clp protease proteolytic subunit [Amycolatopsis xylanica]SDW48511.1 ATP-dependent Clp protease, protease subunit [Amycolatopsis xylanica]